MAPTASLAQALQGFSPLRNMHHVLCVWPSAALPFAWTWAGFLGLAGLPVPGPILEMHRYIFGDSHLGSQLRDCLSFWDKSIVLPQNSACGSTVHTNCFFDALLTSVFPCTSQKITLFLLYSAGRHNVTESLAVVLVNNLSFKCSPGMPETNNY